MTVRITIITSTLNCAAALDVTADSIRCQTYRNVQWIIADGGSTDGTIDRVDTSVVDHWLSEPDDGIYDAWNKACRFIDGDWVLFLGAGDVLTAPNTLERIATELQKISLDVAIAYGNVVQKVGGVERRRFGEVSLNGWDHLRPALPSHQGVFARARLLQSSKPFDATYKVAGDSKFLLLALRDGGNARYVDIDVAHWEPGGISEQPRSTLKVMRELLRLENDLGYRIPRGRRAFFVARSYLRYAVFRIAGETGIDLVVRLKRSLLRFGR